MSADVIIENNGRVRVVDLDELGDALTENIISCELMSDAIFYKWACTQTNP